MILVVSPGRCGSSTVARILHERLGVNMGNKFREPDKENPNGFYEDVEFKNLNEALIRGMVTLEEFGVRIKALIDSKSGEWGIKDPRLCEVCGVYLKYIPEAKIIITERPREIVVKSYIKSYGWTQENSERLYDRRVNAIRFVYTLNPIIISFKKEKSDDEIYNIFKEKLWQKQLSR